MDRKDYILQKISQESARKTKPVYQEDENKIYREALERVYDDRSIGEEGRAEIKHRLEDPKMYVIKDKVDQKQAQAAQDHAEREIKKAIKSGILPPPDHDEYVRRHGH